MSFSPSLENMDTKHPLYFFTAVTDFTITKERGRVMTFSTPLDQIYHVVVIRNPLSTYHFEAYTLPLTNMTWLILLTWIIVTPPVLFIVSRYPSLNRETKYPFELAFQYNTR